MLFLLVAYFFSAPYNFPSAVSVFRNPKNPRRKAKAKFFNLHSISSRNQKMPKLVDENQKTKNQDENNDCEHNKLKTKIEKLKATSKILKLFILSCRFYLPELL